MQKPLKNKKLLCGSPAAADDFFTSLSTSFYDSENFAFGFRISQYSFFVNVKNG